jgi:hypothetical protein
MNFAEHPNEPKLEYDHRTLRTLSRTRSSRIPPTGKFVFVVLGSGSQEVVVLGVGSAGELCTLLLSERMFPRCIMHFEKVLKTYPREASLPSVSNAARLKFITLV